jgi:hypothetical protein
VTLTGDYLLGAAVTTDNPGIQVGATRATDETITTTFTLADTAVQGSTVVTVTTATGEASVPFAVLAAAQAPSLTPDPLVVGAFGKTASVVVSLPAAEAAPTTVRLASDDPDILTVEQPQVTIPAGETAVTATVVGGTPGFTTLTADSGAATDTVEVMVGGLPWGTPLVAQAATVSISLAAPPLPPVISGLAAPPVAVNLAPPPPATLGTLDAPPVSVALAVQPPAAVIDAVAAPPVSVTLEGVSGVYTPLLAASVSVRLELP